MKRFFCENCGEEVEEDQELCPHCGAIFTAIKCPRCGYRGKLHEFFNGCPSCGFLGEDRVRETSHTPIAGGGEPFLDPWPPGRNNPRKNRKKRPPWLFWLLLVAMVASFIGLSIVYMSI